MRYDFDKMTDRRGTGSLKWDVPERELPMWVADMDFETAPEVREALTRRVEHGIFGYNVVTRDWYEAYQGWWGQRHHLELEQEWLVFCTGVVPAISSAVRKLTTVGENVLVQTPVYNIFFNSIRNNGRNILESPLAYDGREYSIDFRDLEEGADSGNDQARVALEVFAYRVAKYVGSYVAAMNGVDVIAFTAGIGENSGTVRSAVAEYLGYLGIEINEEANKRRGEEIQISTPDSKVKVMVIPTNEELAIARETVALV